MAANFTPTPAELALVNQIFAQADTQKIGILTGDVAVRLFGGAKLQPSVLGEIWNIADEDNNGFLTRKGVAIVIRLMGWAQKGEKISPALLNKSGPLATIEGVHAPLVPQGTGMSIPKSPPPGLPLLTPQDKAKFSRLFQGCGPVNGLLTGDKARDVFFKSKLPVDKLSQVWALADTQNRGALDLTDFTIAMYLIQASMSGQLSFIPSSLPPGLYEQAGGTALVAHATGSSAHAASPATTSFPAAPKQPHVQTNFTGQSNLAPTLPSRRAAPAPQAPAVPPFPGVVPQATGHWDVTPAEKASADRFFDTLDSQKRGYIEGDVAVPFMLQSKLSEDVLAQVWDLADMNNDGRLTRDGFAVGMHLIQGKLSGKEIPGTLPPSLVPPSMRSNGPTQPFATVPSQLEPIRDLLWDDSPPASTANTLPQTNVLQPQSTGIMPVTASPPPMSRPQQVLEDPFGSSAPQASFHKDLLGDDDEAHTSPPLHDRSAEIGNVQNQLNSTNRALQSTKAEREALETTLVNQAAQLSALQTQLASAKASFDTETSLLNTFNERHAAQKAEIQKVREELIRSESDLSAVRVEKAEIEGAFLRDKEEVRDLNRRMAEVTTQISTVKQEIEKAKKDAKQQKGLLAIARKQLATKESEKAKVDQELEEAQEDLTNTVKEREEAEAEVEKPSESQQPPVERVKSPADSLAFAAAQPLPLTPELTGGGPMSPTPGKSNNPFERLAMSSGTATPRSQSPFRSFSTASIPLPPGLPLPTGLSPPGAVVTTNDDPFGISQAFESEPPSSSEVAPDNDEADLGASTPRVKATVGDFGEVVSSPTDEELFSTPPNSITPVNHGVDSVPHIPSLDSAAAHFPALDDIAEISPRQGEGKENETDLSTDLHDLDVNDTDSDDGDSDEESHEETSPDQDSHPAEPSTKNESAPPPVPVTFDDIFGAGSDAAVVAPTKETAPQTDIAYLAQNSSSGVDAFGAPLIKPAATPSSDDFQDSGFTFIDPPVNVSKQGSSGLSSFDEAFGKTSSSGPAPTDSNFSFDSAFEDNFDFSASAGTATEFPSMTSSNAALANGTSTTGQNVAVTANNTQDIFSQPVNGGTQATLHAAPLQVPASFDATLPSPWSATPNPPQPEKAVATQPSSSGISFEEAFGGLNSSQALKLDDTFSSRAPNTLTSSASPPPFDFGKQFPAASPPTSPRGPSSPRVTSIRSGSPQPRTMSPPPPQTGSPKNQRPSTSSSTKEVTQEKPAPPPRHSKLSIRLPFGKKKKTQEAPPVPASHPVQQPPRVDELGTVPPAVDDDVEPVKQLAAMGFSRNQAVAALEAHDYDFQRALNSLLGGQ